MDTLPVAFPLLFLREILLKTVLLDRRSPFCIIGKGQRWAKLYAKHIRFIQKEQDFL